MILSLLLTHTRAFSTISRLMLLCSPGTGYLASTSVWSVLILNHAVPPAAFFISSSLSLFQLPKARMNVDMPKAAVVTAKTAFNPTMYASRTMGTCKAVNS